MIAQINKFNFLRKYQMEGVKFLYERDSALLADEMGLGKTVQTIIAIQLLLSQKKCNRIIIVCPASLCINWQNEFKRWTPQINTRILKGNSEVRWGQYILPYDVWISSYEIIKMDIDFIEKDLDFDLVVLDEAQRIKNIDSEVSFACRLISRKKSWALTGTPLENKLEDLLSILQFLKPGLVSISDNNYNLHKIIMPYFLRRKKIDVLSELPPIIIQDLILEMSENQKKTYFEEFGKIKKKIFRPPNDIQYSTIEILAQITKLKQICNYDPITGESCKIEALKTIISGLGNENYKVIVFSQYVKTLKFIQTKFIEFPTSLFYGQLSSIEKEKIISNFENSKAPQILLVSIKAGGVGLNLSKASLIILFDKWWNPAVETQAIHRGHRFGRTTTLQVIRFSIEGSIEERIEKILKNKQKLFTEYVDLAQNPKIEPFSLKELYYLLE